MAKQVILSNEVLRVEITSAGASLTSIKKNNKELLWEGNPEVWSGQAPVLFPICGGLKDDKYIFEGKEYTLKRHGFARNSEFEIEKCDDTSAVFLLCSNEETKKVYPFDFEFRIKYALNDNKISISYDVINMGNGDMYYSVGSHEAYACPEGIENYSILFECEENLIASVLKENLLQYNTNEIMKNTKELPLKKEYFAVDALVFTDIKSRKVWLKNNTNNDMIKVDFNGKDYLLLWTKPEGDYICIEPWAGLHDFEDSEYDFSAKRGIIKLNAGENRVHTHTIKFM